MELSKLPLEKQFQHAHVMNTLQNADKEQLLIYVEDLHMLYLATHHMLLSLQKQQLGL